MTDPYLLGFSRIPSVTPSKIRRIRRYFGTLENAWKCYSASQFIDAKINAEWVSLMMVAKESTDLKSEERRLAEAKVTIVGSTDAEYPPLLREIHNPPEWLYVWGSIPSQTMVSVVGTRQMSEYAKRATIDIVRTLVGAGVAVVSGLAFGIDMQAHEATVDHRGKTVAVLGSGLNLVTPRQHTWLAEKIVRSGGAVITEFPFDTGPMPYHFPQRNRIISGCSVGTVVVGAGDKSGALITARFALEQGREVFAVPGSIYLGTSRGCHHLIEQGATIVKDTTTILDELRIRPGENLLVQPLLTDDELTIAKCLSREPVHFDDIVYASGLESAVVGAVLTLLEAKGVVESHAGMRYTKTR